MVAIVRRLSNLVLHTCNVTCFVFRFITILYYLNEVEEGGETAFLIADNTTITPKVSPFIYLQSEP